MHPMGFNSREQIKRARDDASPAVLMARPRPAPFRVEVLVEQNVILPVRVLLKLLGSTIDGALAVSSRRKMLDNL